MPLGNDVVDLRDPETRPGAVHPRFDLRVFTDEEREALGSAPLPTRLRWTLWAAKESAFKAARKLDPELPFHPRRFAVRMTGRGRAEVVHRMAGRFQVWLEEARDWVHAAAATVGDTERPRWALDVLGTDGDEPSPGERARELACRMVAAVLPADAEALRVVTGDDGIPRLMLAGEALPVELSLSHHGRVVACSWSGR